VSKRFHAEFVVAVVVVVVGAASTAGLSGHPRGSIDDLRQMMEICGGERCNSPPWTDTDCTDANCSQFDGEPKRCQNSDCLYCTNDGTSYAEWEGFDWTVYISSSNPVDCGLLQYGKCTAGNRYCSCMTTPTIVPCSYTEPVVYNTDCEPLPPPPDE
jgi:hypothetical protein